MKLQDVLSAHNECLLALESVLGKEQSKLLAGHMDVPHLESLASEKQALLAQLDLREADRLALQDGAGLGSDGAGATQLAIAGGCESEWRAILALAERTALENERNGRILAIRLEGNEQVLRYIRSTVEKREYTAQGTQRAQGGRLSVSA